MRTTAYILIERENEEIELEIEGYYTPGTPGRKTGPPEDCYPDDPGEVEIDTIFFQDKPWGGTLTDKESHKALEALIASGEDLIKDAAYD